VAARQATIGRWWRFSAYEVRDGAILPARGALLSTYDPWAEYAASSTGRVEDRGASPQQRHGKYARPYQALLDLYRQIAFSGDPLKLTSPAEAALLRWVSDFGLLGILPHRATAIYEPQHDEDGSSVLRSVYPGPGRWYTRREARTSSKWPAAPGALLRDLGGSPPRWVPLAQIRDRFFPDARTDAAFSVPAPFTAAFWDTYAEPLEEFVSAARLFRDVVLYVAPPPRAPRRQRRNQRVNHATEEARRNRFTRAGRTLHALLEPVGPALEIVEGRVPLLRHRWPTPTLLASFATMFLLDITGGKQVLTCAARRGAGVCGRVLISGDPRAKYCSETCKEREKKRRHPQRRDRHDR
jgi:hypothetical protein